MLCHCYAIFAPSRKFPTKSIENRVNRFPWHALHFARLSTYPIGNGVSRAICTALHFARSCNLHDRAFCTKPDQTSRESISPRDLQNLKPCVIFFGSSKNHSGETLFPKASSGGDLWAISRCDCGEVFLAEMPSVFLPNLPDRFPAAFPRLFSLGFLLRFVASLPETFSSRISADYSRDFSEGNSLRFVAGFSGGFSQAYFQAFSGAYSVDLFPLKKRGGYLWGGAKNFSLCRKTRGRRLFGVVDYQRTREVHLPERLGFVDHRGILTATPS